MKKFYLLTKTLLVAALLMVGASNVWADAVTTWKVNGSTATTANNTLVDDDGLTATAVFATTRKSDAQTISGESFTHYIQVRTAADPTVEVPTGTENSGSTTIVITPKYDGELTVYFRRQSTAQTDNKGTYASNDGKDLKVYKQSDVSVQDGVLTISSETDDGKYGWAKKVVNLSKGIAYTLCARNTTIQFYGFKYSYDDGFTDTWSRTIDDAYGISEFTGDVELQNRSNSDATQVAGVFVGSGSKSIGYTFPSATFTASTTYVFSFDYAMSSLNNSSSSRSDLTFTSSTGTQMFKLKSADASGNKNILVYIGTSTDELSKDKTGDDYTANCLYASSTSGGKGTNNKPKASNWYTVTISANEDDGTWVTFTPQFTEDGYGEISEKISDGVVYIGSLSSTIGQYYGCLWIDNLKLRQVVSGDFVADPNHTITAPVNTNRKFELSCETDGATIYWATSELAKGADGWTEYTTEVSTAATTIYAYAEKGSGTSNIISFATGAGTTVPLNGATYSLAYYNLSSSSFYVKVSDNQSYVLGAPSATLAYYTSNPSSTTDCTSGNYISGFAPGSTVYVVASADGYASTTTSYTFPVLGAEGLVANWSDDLTSGEALTGGDTEKLGNINCQLITAIGETTLSGNFGVYPDVTTSRWNPTTDGIVGGSYYTGAKNVSNLGYIKMVVSASTYEDSKISARKDVAFSYAEKNADGSYNLYFTPSGSTCCWNGVSGITIKSVSYLASVSATIGSDGYASFSSTYALDFSSVAGLGLEAYIATSGNESFVNMVQVDDAAAGTGLILKGDAGTYSIPVAASGTDHSATNKLWAISSDGKVTKAADDSYTNYVLAKQSGEVVFAPVTGGNSVNVTAGHAALCLENTPTAHAIRMSFGGEITEVNAVEATSEAKAQEGKFIENGKLVIVKNGKKFNANGQLVK